MEELSIVIKPAEEDQLSFLESELSPDSYSKYHFYRFAAQKRGDGVYLIAWAGNVPVGHFLLRWKGPERDDSNGRYPPNTPYIEALGTREGFRNKGVATKLIKEAEKLAKEKGNSKIGLAVGLTDNPTARKLYEKLGFKDWGQGAFVTWWEFTAKDGSKGIESEEVTFMFKNLL